MTTVINGTSTSASAPAVVGDDSNSGVYFPSSDQVAIATNGTQAVLVDASQNIGVAGVTPSAWAGNYKSIQIGQTAAFGGNSGLNRAYMFSNTWFDGSNYKYLTTSQASWYEQSNGAHYWFSAGSGSAGATMTQTQVLNLDVGKTLALQGATSQTGTGVTFPASQSASSDANTLDDYEEGTYTPTITGSSVNPTGVTYSNQIGRYTKIGDLVFCVVNIDITNAGSSGAGQLGVTLPFTANSTPSYNPTYPNLENFVTTRSAPMGLVLNSTAVIRFWYGNGGTAGMTGYNWGTDTTNNMTIRFAVVYKTS